MSRLKRVLEWLPRDMSLSEDEFRSRHRAMTLILLLHVPVLFAYGFTRGFDVTALGIELAFPLVAALLGALPMIRRRLRTFAVTTGLSYSSVALLHLSGGSAESALHFLIMLAFVFLYREWFLFAWSITLMGFSYRLLALTEGVLGEAMVATGEPEMSLPALMSAATFASIGLVLAWKSAADSQAATIEALEIARERDEAAARRDAYGKMYVNLARRSQSLVDRQLSVIDRLEKEVDDPDMLAGVFELDHLTTRIRRHGESLLVVADVDLPTRTEPAALADVVRGAQSEIEQYRRVDARVDPSVSVTGAATRDLLHVLAELLDNATTYSPPNTTVKVHARAGSGGSVVLTIEDSGIGLSDERIEQANRDLKDTDALDENSIRHLGFRVIARLAAKHDIDVRLSHTNGGGVTAWVELPSRVLASADLAGLTPARVPGEARTQPPAAPAQAEPAAAAEPDVAATPPSAPPAAPAAPAAAAAPPAPAMPAAPAAPPAPAAPVSPAAEAPAGEAPATPPGPPAPPAPVPLSAGFSASGRRRRGRRSRNPVTQAHDRTPVAAPEADAGERPQPPAAPDPEPPIVDRPIATSAVRLPRPTVDDGAPGQDAPGADTADVVASSNGAPPLPKRRRGASMQASAEEEAMDLFGALDDAATGDRSSLGDFQRGQEAAREEGRP